MDPNTIENISNHIYQRFPEVAGIKPTVRKQPVPDSQKQVFRKSESQNYLLTFKSTIKGPNGQKIPRWIRVVASLTGKIVKISTSK